jgi:hypothetical protein
MSQGGLARVWRAHAARTNRDDCGWRAVLGLFESHGKKAARRFEHRANQSFFAIPGGFYGFSASALNALEKRV